MRRHVNRPDIRPLRLIGLDATRGQHDLEHLAMHTDVLHLPAGVSLARAGRAVRQFIAVVDGEIDIGNQSGQRRVAGPGAHVGADELLRGRLYDVDVVTRTECTLLVIFGPSFKAILQPTPPVRHQSRRLGSAREVLDVLIGGRITPLKPTRT